MRKPKILFYDIETTLLQIWNFSLGKNIIRHQQLVEGKWDRWHIICLSYCFNDGPIKVLDWGYKEQDDTSILLKFQKLVDEADIIIGKNSNKFDNKMYAAMSMLKGIPGNTEWLYKTDDLEKQFRKHFKLPSQSLDYISSQLGLGGKDSMSFQDWVDIQQKTPGRGLAAFNKMKKYNKKDVEDTRAIWNYAYSHFEPRYNYSTAAGRLVCKKCGGENIAPNGSHVVGGTKYRKYVCMDGCGNAGRHPFNQKNPKTLK